MVGFGWTNIAEERTFLAAVDALLVEIGVQMTARGLESNDAVRGLHDAVVRYSDGLDGDNPVCRCGHPTSNELHDVDGCTDADSLTMERCQCQHRSGLARTQVRAWVEPAVTVAAEGPSI
ncbi:hypothetical protein [Curtobacterium sp. MCPF17_031]|uniref:hypothetical protein n=1 Tax=Curtobacterium sp. MCPF17_031 TaxID=2175653 RepID=UPI000DA944B4|nr:hypothetical protein [Curtobacterium sp. MCPF17_031]PZE36945.1 hypothetical protein DEJ31_07295 [Curtobacterium sp. MCPF17_031]